MKSYWVNSSMGVRTTSWGGPLWHALFCMAVNYEDHPSPNKKSIYLNYFDLLGHMLPCHFCREYYEQCITFVLPLKHFLDDPKMKYPVVYWLYLLKDLVNQKLIRQEAECYAQQSLKIEQDLTLSKRAKTVKKQDLKDRIFYTEPSPPFDDILAFYLSMKSTCESNDINKSLQSCRHIPDI